MVEWHLQPIFESYVIVAWVALVLIALLPIGPLFTRTTGRRSLVLAGLRILPILLLLVVMLGPSRQFTQTRRLASTLIILVDTSRSMQVEDMPKGATRWKAIRQALADARLILSDLDEAEEVEVVVYTFDSTAKKVEFDGQTISLPDQPIGDQTAIGTALDRVLAATDRSRLLGVVLMSDGAETSLGSGRMPRDMALRMADLELPLYAIAFGDAPSQKNTRDVAVANLIASRTVSVRNSLLVEAEIRVEGYTGKEIVVDLFWEKSDSGKTQPNQDRKPLKFTKVVASDDDRRPVVKLQLTPQEVGNYKLTIRAAHQPGEIQTTNNEKTVDVYVNDDKVNVFYLEGAIRPERRFLRSAIQGSPDITMDHVMFYSTKRNEWPKSVASAIGRRFEPDHYHVYIFGDLDSDAFYDKLDGVAPELDDRTLDQKYPLLAQLAETVEQGAGLIMLGGLHSFDAGGFDQTPLAAVMPIKELPGDEDRVVPLRQKFGKVADPRLHIKGPLLMLPAAPVGTRHFVMRLEDGADITAAWRKLPPLDAANKIVPRSDASVLAESDKAQPLLVVRDAGSGRVLAFAGDSTWRWCLEGEEKTHRRFWRQVVLWLSGREKEKKGSVWIDLDQPEVRLNQRVNITAGAVTSKGQAVAGGQFKATLRSVSKNSSFKPRAIRLIQKDAVGKLFTGSDAGIRKPGDYLVHLEVQDRENNIVGTDEFRFTIADQDLELADPRADPELMDRLSKLTADSDNYVEAFRTRAINPEDLSELLEAIKELPEQLEIEFEESWTFGRQPLDASLLLFVFVGVLAAEWYLRKKWNLA